MHFKAYWANYINQLKNLKIVLKSYAIDKPVPSTPIADAPVSEQEAYQKHSKDMDAACSIMLASMSSELQKQFDHMDAPTILLY